MKKTISKLYLIIVVSFLLLFVCGCVEMDLDISVKNDGSGRADITVRSTRPYYNNYVDEFVEDVRLKEPKATIKERMVGLKKEAEVRVSFDDVADLSKHKLGIHHSYNGSKHYIEISEIPDVSAKVTLNMPGKVIASNGIISGSKVTWDEGYMTETYWAESEVTELNAAIIILSILFGLIVIVLLMLFVRRPMIKHQGSVVNTGVNKPCSNCDFINESDDFYCASCGAQLSTKLLFHKKYNSVKLFYLSLSILAVVVLMIIGYFLFRDTTSHGRQGFVEINNEVATDVNSDVINMNKIFNDYCNGWFMGGANITNSFFNAAEKELLPPFTQKIGIILQAGFSGEFLTTDRDAIYVVGNYGNKNCTLFKYDRKTGDLLWSYSLGVDGKCGGPAVIMDQFIYLGGQSSKKTQVLEIETGTLVNSLEPINSLYIKPLKVYDNSIYFYGSKSSNHNLLGSFRIDTDQVEWVTPDNHAKSEIAIFDKYIIGGRIIDNKNDSINTIVLMRPTGTVIWESDEARGNAVTTDGKYVYTLAGNDNATLTKIVAYSVESGKEIWVKPLQVNADYYSKIAVSDHHLVVAANIISHSQTKSLLIIVNKLSGEILYEYDVEGYINNLTIANGHTYLNTDSKFISCNLNSGIMKETILSGIRDMAISNQELTILTEDRIISISHLKSGNGDLLIQGLDESLSVIDGVGPNGEIFSDWWFLLSGEALNKIEGAGQAQIESEILSWSGGIYSGPLLNGVPHGWGTWNDQKGKIYEGDFFEGKMTGYGTMIFPKGEKYVGYFLNGKGHGQGTMTHPDGRNVIGNWINGEYAGNN